MDRPYACSASKHVTTETAARALYLDFEGPGRSSGSESEPAPVLAGVRCDGEYKCTVLDERFADAAAALGARLQRMPEFLAGLLKRALVEGRRIAFWSSHESQVFAANGLELGEVALDVRPAARKLFPERFKAARAARPSCTSQGSARPAGSPAPCSARPPTDGRSRGSTAPAPATAYTPEPDSLRASFLRAAVVSLPTASRIRGPGWVSFRSAGGSGFV